MKKSRLDLPGFPQYTIHEALQLSKNLAAPAGPWFGNAILSKTGDPAGPNVEKAIYSLIDLCIRIFEMEAKKNKISGMQGKSRDLNPQTAATMKKKEIYTRKITSA